MQINVNNSVSYNVLLTDHNTAISNKVSYQNTSSYVVINSIYKTVQKYGSPTYIIIQKVIIMSNGRHPRNRTSEKEN